MIKRAFLWLLIGLSIVILNVLAFSGLWVLASAIALWATTYFSFSPRCTIPLACGLLTMFYISTQIIVAVWLGRVLSKRASPSSGPWE